MKIQISNSHHIFLHFFKVKQSENNKMPPKKFELLRSLESSHQEPIDTIVTGVIPVWLSGTLFKNGTGRYEYGNKYYKHFFDGHACIHKFKIERGTNKVIYSNRILNTKAFTRSLAENRLYPVFGTVDLCSNLFGRLKTVFKFHETMDNANVNVVPFGEFYFNLKHFYMI
jgi:carotenoid cleavage dioxygenase-like enzyme